MFRSFRDRSLTHLQWTDSLESVTRSWLRLLRMALALWLVLVLPLAFLADLGGDCGFATERSGTVDATCVHSDADCDEAPGQCPIDHHGASPCGCACHNVSVVFGVVTLIQGCAAERLCGSRVESLLDRRDTPPLRPPIAG